MTITTKYVASSTSELVDNQEVLWQLTSNMLQFWWPVHGLHVHQDLLPSTNTDNQDKWQPKTEIGNKEIMATTEM